MNAVARAIRRKGAVAREREKREEVDMSMLAPHTLLATAAALDLVACVRSRLRASRSSERQRDRRSSEPHLCKMKVKVEVSIDVEIVFDIKRWCHSRECSLRGGNVDELSGSRSIVAAACLAVSNRCIKAPDLQVRWRLECARQVSPPGYAPRLQSLVTMDGHSRNG